MAAEYTIVSVDAGPREWHGGGNSTFHAFRCTLRNHAGAEKGDVEINKKPGHVPSVGQSIYGDVGVGRDDRPKFTNAQRPGGAPAPSGGGGGQPQANGNGGAPAGDRGFGWQTNPVDAARMNRAHAQEMAIRFLAAEVEAAVLADAEAPAVSLDQVRELTDHFERDVNGAPTRAASSAKAEQAQAPAQEQPAAQPVPAGAGDGDPGPEDPGYGGDDDIPF